MDSRTDMKIFCHLREGLWVKFNFYTCSFYHTENVLWIDFYLFYVTCDLYEQRYNLIEVIFFLRCLCEYPVTVYMKTATHRAEQSKHYRTQSQIPLWYTLKPAELVCHHNHHWKINTSNNYQMRSLEFSPAVNVPNSCCMFLGATVGKPKFSFPVIAPPKSHRFCNSSHLCKYSYVFVPQNLLVKPYSLPSLHTLCLNLPYFFSLKILQFSHGWSKLRQCPWFSCHFNPWVMQRTQSNPLPDHGSHRMAKAMSVPEGWPVEGDQQYQLTCVGGALTTHHQTRWVVCPQTTEAQCPQKTLETFSDPQW